jgi:hypothetical protein
LSALIVPHWFVGGVRYVYGFSATQEKIIDEWLYQYPKGSPQNLKELLIILNIALKAFIKLDFPLALAP